MVSNFHSCDKLHLMDARKAEIAAFMKRTYDRGLTTATGGNISMRIGNVMLINPSGKDKASLSAEDIAEVSILDGANLTPDKRLSIETGMHRAIYLARPDVSAIVHSHPVYSSLFSASDEAIDTCIIAESYYLLGDVVKVPYALMGTEKLAANAARCVAGGANAMLLENHGALAVGPSVLQAMNHMEAAEAIARVVTTAKLIGREKELPEEECRALLSMQEKNQKESIS